MNRRGGEAEGNTMKGCRGKFDNSIRSHQIGNMRRNKKETIGGYVRYIFSCGPCAAVKRPPF